MTAVRAVAAQMLPGVSIAAAAGVNVDKVDNPQLGFGSFILKTMVQSNPVDMPVWRKKFIMCRCSAQCFGLLQTW